MERVGESERLLQRPDTLEKDARERTREQALMEEEKDEMVGFASLL